MFALHTRGGDFMGRVLDIGRLLRQLRPELAPRVRLARLPFQGRLTLRIDQGEAAIVITEDDVLVDSGANGGFVIELPLTALARLPNQPGHDAAALLRMLFPRRMPHIYPMDRF